MAYERNGAAKEAAAPIGTVKERAFRRGNRRRSPVSTGVPQFCCSRFMSSLFFILLVILVFGIVIIAVLHLGHDGAKQPVLQTVEPRSEEQSV
jgi:hypothetical protein